MAHQNGRLCPEASMECDTLRRPQLWSDERVAGFASDVQILLARAARADPRANALGSASVIPMRLMESGCGR